MVAAATRSVLFLARIAPSKHPEVLIEALGILKQRDVAFSASIVGSPAPADAPYYWQLRARVRELGMDGRVTFLPSAPNERTPVLYRAHEVFVNASPSGMFDKTLFEAAACGCTVLAVSDDWRREAGDALWFDGTPVSLAAALERSFGKGAADLRHLAEEHSLERLVRAFGELADPEHRYNG